MHNFFSQDVSHLLKKSCDGACFFSIRIPFVSSAMITLIIMLGGMFLYPDAVKFSSWLTAIGFFLSIFIFSSLFLVFTSVALGFVLGPFRDCYESWTVCLIAGAVGALFNLIPSFIIDLPEFFIRNGILEHQLSIASTVDLSFSYLVFFFTLPVCTIICRLYYFRM